MGEYPEATYAALRHEYAPRDPFAEFGQHQISLNELRILVTNLPPDSAMHRADPNHRGWTQLQESTTSIAEGIAYLQWMYASANRGENDPVPQRPEPVTRPWQAAQIAAEESERAEAAVEFTSWWRDLENQIVQGEVVSRG